MARGKKRSKSVDTKSKIIALSKVEKKTELAKPVENKVKFLVWFSAALGRFKQLKPHHMSPVKTYLIKDLGMNEPECPSAYDEGLVKFGFGK